MKKGIIFSLALVAVVGLLLGCQGVLGPKEIKIGAILPLTGDAQRIGNMKKDGADLAIDIINNKGGINGKKVVIIYEDSQNDPTKGIAAFKKLTEIDNVSVIMSAMSGVSMALVPIAGQKQVVLFANVGHPQVTGQNDWVFRNFPTAEQEAIEMVKFINQKLKIKKVAILYPNDDWGLSGHDAFKKEFLMQGGQIVAEESYEKTDTDFKVQLAKIKTKNPEALYFTGFGNALGIIAKQGVEMGVRCKYISTTGFNDKAIITLSGNASEGVYFTTPAFNADSKDTVVSNFVNLFENKYGRKPAFDEALQFDTVVLILKAILNSDNVDNVKIRKTISNTDNYQGVCGATVITAKGDLVTPLVIKVIKNGLIMNN